MFTHIRVTTTDYSRIKDHLERLRKKQRYGRVAQHDVITELLDVYEEKINKTNEKSSTSEENYSLNTK